MEGLFLLFGGAFILSAPLWVPLVALAYAIGRKRFSLLFLFALITAEAISLGLIGLVIWNIGPIGPGVNDYPPTAGSWTVVGPGRTTSDQ